VVVQLFRICRLIKTIRRPAGFTLIECMVSIAILTIFLMGVVSMQAYFGTQTSDRELRTCLLENAASALAQRRNGSTATSFAFTCRHSSGTVTIGASTLAGTNPGSCQAVTATATAQSKSASVTTSVCSF
jgi:prepilin-type N-terminal cleavage/methylation domain-containing protein